MALPFPLNHFGTDPTKAVIAAVGQFRNRFARVVKRVAEQKRIDSIVLTPGVRLPLKRYVSADNLQVAARWVAILKKYPAETIAATFAIMSEPAADDDSRSFEPITMTAIAAVVIPLLPVIIPAIAGMIQSMLGAAAESEETKQQEAQAERKKKEDDAKNERVRNIAIAVVAVTALAVGAYYVSSRGK